MAHWAEAMSAVQIPICPGKPCHDDTNEAYMTHIRSSPRTHDVRLFLTGAIPRMHARLRCRAPVQIRFVRESGAPATERKTQERELGPGTQEPGRHGCRRWLRCLGQPLALDVNLQIVPALIDRGLGILWVVEHGGLLLGLSREPSGQRRL